MLRWFGLRCPSCTVLDAECERLGAPVLYHIDFDSPRYFWDDNGNPWFIGIPESYGYLSRCWWVANELSRLLSHSSRSDDPSCARQAERWAASALIPDLGIKPYATLDECLVCLHRGYMEGRHVCPADLELAARIAYTRLTTIKRMTA